MFQWGIKNTENKVLNSLSVEDSYCSDGTLVSKMASGIKNKIEYQDTTKAQLINAVPLLFIL